MRVAVIGSINMDLVTFCKKVPKEGETLFGEKFRQIPGGKGANQAVAISRLGVETVFFGKVGNDSFGKELKENLKKDGIDVSNIEVSKESTGIAKILVEDGGKNRILVVPGANFEVDKMYIDKNIKEIAKCDVIVVQLEIPLETVGYLFSKEELKEKIILLNPAPAAKLKKEIIKRCDFIIPNETELQLLSGIEVLDEKGLEKACDVLLKDGAKNVIVTLGEKGVFYKTERKEYQTSAYKVDVVDTTAAGDSFIGGFVSGLCEKMKIEDAIEKGIKTSAISVTRVGAQTSIPTKKEVEEFKGVKR